MARYYKLNCLTVAVGNRVLRKEHNEVYQEDVFGDKAKNLEEQRKIVRVSKSGKPLSKKEKEKADKEEEGSANQKKAEQQETEQKEEGSEQNGEQ